MLNLGVGTYTVTIGRWVQSGSLVLQPGSGSAWSGLVFYGITSGQLEVVKDHLIKGKAAGNGGSGGGASLVLEIVEVMEIGSPTIPQGNNGGTGDGVSPDNGILEVVVEQLLLELVVQHQKVVMEEQVHQIQLLDQM